MPRKKKEVPTAVVKKEVIKVERVKKIKKIFKALKIARRLLITVLLSDSIEIICKNILISIDLYELTMLNKIP